MNNWTRLAVIGAAVMNSSLAASFIYNLLADPAFTVMAARPQPESAVATVVGLLLWFMFHAGLFAAIIVQDEA